MLLNTVQFLKYRFSTWFFVFCFFLFYLLLSCGIIALNSLCILYKKKPLKLKIRATILQLLSYYYYHGVPMLKGGYTWLVPHSWLRSFLLWWRKKEHNQPWVMDDVPIYIQHTKTLTVQKKVIECNKIWKWTSTKTEGYIKCSGIIRISLVVPVIKF